MSQKHEKKNATSHTDTCMNSHVGAKVLVAQFDIGYSSSVQSVIEYIIKKSIQDAEFSLPIYG